MDADYEDSEDYRVLLRDVFTCPYTAEECNSNGYRKVEGGCLKCKEKWLGEERFN